MHRPCHQACEGDSTACFRGKSRHPQDYRAHAAQ